MEGLGLDGGWWCFARPALVGEHLGDQAANSCIRGSACKVCRVGVRSRGHAGGRLWLKMRDGPALVGEHLGDEACGEGKGSRIDV
jgi:hypothetical protein